MSKATILMHIIEFLFFKNHINCGDTVAWKALELAKRAYRAQPTELGDDELTSVQNELNELK